jgi:Tfp pilus assembly protein PilN
MKPRAMTLDFVAEPRAIAWCGRGLAVLGVCALLILAYALHQLYEQSTQLESQLAARDDRDKTRAVHGKQRNDAVLDVAALTPELSTPWSALLTELEVAARDERGRIAILALEPDRQKKIVRLRGQARTMEQVLAFVQRLAASPLLAHPMLDTHETRVEEAERPIEFQISAEWVAHS